MFRKRTIIFLVVIAGLIGLGFVFGWWDGASFEFKNSPFKGGGDSPNYFNKQSPISGLACDNYRRRPIAVMLAGDSVVRPLSGLSEADLVVEMPVITGSITRFMAVYVCNSPSEIGSLRSARHDFIPLAMGLDAIYAHWGGSHFALDKLDAGIMDNINALYNPYSAFYRKPSIPMPHNGFTSMSRLVYAAEKLGYRGENKFKGYSHQEEEEDESRTAGTLTVGYPGQYKVEYDYDPETNSYLRWRGGTKDIDRNNSKQLNPKVVIIMRAASRQIEGQYNDVDVEGEGEIEVYQNGQVIRGTWKKDKDNLSSKLYFLNEKGKEIKFIPGQIWLEIVEPQQDVIWTISQS